MKISLFILLLFVSLLFSGCFTYYPVRENPDSLKVESNRYAKILKIHLLDGTTIDVSEYEVNYYNKYKTNERVFVYFQPDTINSQNPDSVNIKSSEKIIPSEKIKSLIVERRKTDVKSAAFTTLIIVGSAALLYFLIVAISFQNDPNIKL